VLQEPRHLFESYWNSWPSLTSVVEGRGCPPSEVTCGDIDVCMYVNIAQYVSKAIMIYILSHRHFSLQYIYKRLAMLVLFLFVKCGRRVCVHVAHICVLYCRRDQFARAVENHKLGLSHQSTPHITIIFIIIIIIIIIIM
jgi:hypothetical protein